MFVTDMNKISKMPLAEAQRNKGLLVEAARKINEKLSDPDYSVDADRQAEIETELEGILSAAEASQKRADEVISQREAAIERSKRLDTLAQESSTLPDLPKPGSSIKTEERFTDDPMKGFNSPKAFFNTVIALSQRDATVAEDPRVKYLATAGTDEHSGQSDPYGGLLVPVAMSPDVRTVGADQNPFLGNVTSVPMQTRAVDVLARVDKDHSSSVSGGLTVSRRDETNSISSSRMQLEKVSLKATGLFGLAYATRELMQDSPQSISALLQQGFDDEFPATILEEMISGNTPGKLEGILNTPATITVAKEGGQAADTITANNVLKMRQRAWRFGAGSFWVANHDTYLQLTDLQVESDNNAGAYWLFRPGNGVDVPDTLLGRPIIFSEFAETLGDKGDLMLISQPSQYLYGVYQPLRSEESMHVRFENHEQVFKFWTENAGAPWWRSALTPKKGANTLSPFVTLAARA